MKIENEKVVRLSYELYVPGEKENDPEEMWEKAPAEHPLVYCHGMGMMLPKFEEALAGLEAGAKFDFTIGYADAYGDYEEDNVQTLPKQIFFNGDGEFDAERVYEGAIVPLQNADGRVFNAQVASVDDETVTVDFNHPLAGEDLHFKGEVIDIREATAAELDAIRHPHRCGGCGGGCKSGNCDGGCEGGCGGCE